MSLAHPVNRSVAVKTAISATRVNLNGEKPGFSFMVVNTPPLAKTRKLISISSGADPLTLSIWTKSTSGPKDFPPDRLGSKFSF
jgi:hypothetical protein